MRVEELTSVCREGSYSPAKPSAKRPAEVSAPDSRRLKKMCYLLSSSGSRLDPKLREGVLAQGDGARVTEANNTTLSCPEKQIALKASGKMMQNCRKLLVKIADKLPYFAMIVGGSSSCPHAVCTCIRA